MKVAIVLNTSWNIYNFRKGLVESFLEKGYEVFTIAPVDKFTPKLTEMGCRHLPVRMDSRGANPLKDFLLVVELWNIYRKIRTGCHPAFHHQTEYLRHNSRRFLGIPVINNVCGLGTMFLKDNLVSRIAITLYRIAFRIPRKIFFQNSDDRELFLKKRITKNSVTDLLPGSGIDLNEFFPDRSPKNEHFTFLLISRLIYDKGITEFMDAIQDLRERGIDAKFQVLGGC